MDAPNRFSNGIQPFPYSTGPSFQEMVAEPSQASTSSSIFGGVNNIVITGGQFISQSPVSNGPPRRGGIELQKASPTTSESYQHHMSRKRSGTALWIPEPNKNLSTLYQARGVSIGDVGIVTTAGSFSFLFNICLPRDHPVNPLPMPEWYQPIQPEVDPCDIREIDEFVPGSYLASGSITKTQADSETSMQALSYKFDAQPGDGAILVMPEGAISQDLENISKFRTYAAANLEHWYRYANGTRGREVENGDLRLVIGCDKASSWALASLSESNHANTIQLRAASKDSTRQAPAYSWDFTGPFVTRVSPIQEKGNIPKDTNHCLFVRTLNLKLNPKEWGRVNKGLQVSMTSKLLASIKDAPQNLPVVKRKRTRKSVHTDYDLLAGPPAKRGRGRPRGAKTNTGGAFFDYNGTDGNVDESIQYEGKDEPNDMPAYRMNMLERRTTIRQPLPPWLSKTDSIKHPSNLLHDLMLNMFPEAKMAITEDDEYYSDLFQNEDELHPSDDQLLNRVKNLYDIIFDENAGVVYLEKRIAPEAATGSRPSGSECHSDASAADPDNENAVAFLETELPSSESDAGK